jgi:predicted nuclease with TOPRIM domain
VSNIGDDGEQTDHAALAALESAVGGLLDRLSDVSMRAEEAEGKSEELEALVKRFTGDDAEAGRMLTRLKGLEEENQDLQGRLKKGRASVDRLLAKIRFLEEQR